MNEQSIYEREISDGRTTARVTVDSLSDGTVFSTLALEPDQGHLRQMVMSLTPETIDALMNLLCDAGNAMEDAIERQGAIEAKGRMVA